MADNKPETTVSFKQTLNLPRTDFPIRANAKVDDPALITRWQQHKLYKKTFELHKGGQSFVLHDGPPYANGNIHTGHAYNKILKDIIAKSQRMLGKYVPITPGWDCHGLPIELKVSGENPDVSRTELKSKCRDYAQKWVDVQRGEFKQLGVLMDWDRPYKTMDSDYEATIIRSFGKFVADGYIERKNKTVPWCPSCKTVLAMAEIEYQDRKDPSVYVQFPLVQELTDAAVPSLTGKEVSLLVWTTTPWTLPLNRALLIKPSASYAVLDINGTYVMLGAALADKLCAAMDVSKNVIAEIKAEDILSSSPRAQHPFIDDLTVPILGDQSVDLGEGTACVHSAPGAGPIDYEIGIKNNLEIYSPVGPDGAYTDEVQPAELVGMPVTDGQIWVIRKLAALGRMLYKTSLRHSYPHCWRCRGGLIFRATKQWFCDLNKHDLKARALKATEQLLTVPEKSINQLQATIEGRLEWCLSRQRVWGVPIVAFICQSCDYTHNTPELINAIADQVAQHGIEYWDGVDTSLLNDMACPKCSKKDWKKEEDIIDVWFESGVSHEAVLQHNPDVPFPADMYLEGKDQHRAWFQSSLLISMVLNDEPPMRSIVTHGFTVDSKGRKMSKSIGNVVAPQEMINKLGTDGLRLWASSIDCSGDAVVSDILIKNVQEVFRKIRNTKRFLLSNLYDFDIKKDANPFEHMRVIDQHALQELYAFNYKVLKAYTSYDLTAVFHLLADYCAVSLSSLYLDIVKDRLYVEAPDGQERRSAQTACWYILDTLTRLTAPILSFTAEQVSDHYQNKAEGDSIHLQQFNLLENVATWIAHTSNDSSPIPANRGDVAQTIDDGMMFAARNAHQEQWDALYSTRSALLKAIEELREQGIIKHSLEARITMHLDPQASTTQALQPLFELLKAHGQTPEGFFKEILIVSQFAIAQSNTGLAESTLLGLHVKVEQAQGVKCPRCWHWQETKNQHNLCDRCAAIVT